MLFSPERLTLPVGLSKLQGACTIDYPIVMEARRSPSDRLVLFVFEEVDWARRTVGYSRVAASVGCPRGRAVEAWVVDRC